MGSIVVKFFFAICIVFWHACIIIFIVSLYCCLATVSAELSGQAQTAQHGEVSWRLRQTGLQYQETNLGCPLLDIDTFKQHNSRKCIATIWDIPYILQNKINKNKCSINLIKALTGPPQSLAQSQQLLSALHSDTTYYD